MAFAKVQKLSFDKDQILTILKKIVKDEGNPSVIENETDFSIIGYPVLIGSRAAKWHIPSFREPNDWDFIATASQSILFITKFTVEEIKLIHYSGVGLKISGKCKYIDSSTDGSSINFEIELVSDKVNLRELNKDVDNHDDTEIEIEGEEEVKIKFKKFYSDQEREKSKTSAQMILEFCHDVENRMMLPFPFIVAPLEILEALKASHIYWSTNFYKHIDDLHSLRAILCYNNQVPTTQPLCSPPRNEQINLMLETRINETEMIQGVPGAHINLNKTNEEFLDREDDLFVQRRVPHDELHERVKYGEHPIMKI
jgi:hypothetical protein